MKNKVKKLGSHEPIKSQIYTLTYVAATLDSMPKQCCRVNTDGEETQEQIVFRAVITTL